MSLRPARSTYPVPGIQSHSERPCFNLALHHPLHAVGVELQQKVCARDVPAAEDGMLRADPLEIHVVVGVELRRALADAHHPGGLGSDHFLQVGRRGERAAVARREDVEIAVVGSPDRLVVLRTVTAAGEADFVGRGDDGFLGERRTAVNGDPRTVGILRGGNRSCSLWNI